MMMGKYKFGLTGARCLILCAAAALIGCAIYLFSVSQVEAALEQRWFPFAQIQALTAGIDGETPESVCLILAVRLYRTAAPEQVQAGGPAASALGRAALSRDEKPPDR